MTQHEVKEEIVECLIVHQPFIKKQVQELKYAKEALLTTVDPIFRSDMKEQYDIRVKQWIAFYIGDVLSTISIEHILIELEKIDIEEYLNVA